MTENSPGLAPRANVFVAAPPLPIAGLAAVVCALMGCSSVTSAEAGSGNYTGSADGGSYGTDGDAGDDQGADDDDATDGPADLPMDPGVNACDPWRQDCPEDQRCAWIGDDDPALGPTGDRFPQCVPVAAEPVPIGETCQAINGMDRCERGAHCAFTDAEGFGVCLGLCGGEPDAPECDGGGHCQPCPECPSLCLPRCNPLDDESCHPALTCSPASAEGPFVCSLDAAPLGGGGFQAECEYANQCAPGFDCIEAKLVPGCTSGRCCTPYCELPSGGANGTGAECPGQTTCQPWSPNGPLDGYENLGICKLPV